MELSSALTLEMLGKPFLLEKRIVLLHAIKEHGSISKASKAVPMSYKSAWEAVDTMNSLSPEPIVSRETGGKDGGGTTITEYGDVLLKNYALLKEEHTRFLKRLSEITNIQSGTFETMERLAMQISARNQIQAKVLSVFSHNVNAKIALKLKSGQMLYSVITQEAVEKLHIVEGQTVIAIFKSNNVLLAHENEENILKAEVLEVLEDEEYIKVVVDIGNDDKIVSVISSGIPNEMIPLVGSNIQMTIKSNDIMLGR